LSPLESTLQSASLSVQSIWTFKVIQGHWHWYQSIGRIRFP